MYFKIILSYLFLAPLFGFSQIRFIDTVSIPGYFFTYRMKYDKTYTPSNGLLALHFRFIPASTLQQRTLMAHLQKDFYVEKDTVKFLSWQVPEEFGPWETAEESVKPWISKVKGIRPFYVGQKSYPCGVKNHRIIISYVNVQWLHLRMPGKVACDGFNLPLTFDCGEKAEGREYDVYLPLKLLELEQGIKLKHGIPVHPTKKQ
ncbi:hypothetical protein D3H65_28190 [Paraflavitalea soli]|uniref:Uncharacterized protein n=1 Tax=Paraflavitalea soli TaxID=2315862 RepID=A0A3B7N0S0_9BACT|nr:hypothetical protein [Paraflavitalea soli]AXY77625.1 hypothetical protein D3H65_28190 [Paraflavitalea soli]